MQLSRNFKLNSKAFSMTWAAALPKHSSHMHVQALPAPNDPSGSYRCLIVSTIHHALEDGAPRTTSSQHLLPRCTRQAPSSPRKPSREATTPARGVTGRWSVNRTVQRPCQCTDSTAHLLSSRWRKHHDATRLVRYVSSQVSVCRTRALTWAGCCPCLWRV